MRKPRPKPKLKKRLLAVPKENRLGGPKTAKLPYAEFKQMVLDPDVPDSEIAQYLTANPERGSAFDPAIVPDPSKVEVTAETELDVESAIRWGNAICRFRRQTRFERRLLLGENKPVLVSEGDSWFQFPFLIDDVIDQLAPDFLVWSLDAAGDTSDNMVNRHPEFMKGLELQKANGVAGFLFSGAGNDVIGEDLLGKPVLGSLLKQHQPGKDAVSHIDQAKYAAILSTLRNDYEKLVATVRTRFPRLPVFLHGYDYAIPGGFRGDNRRPVYARQDEWLGGPMKEKGITDTTLQRQIIRLLIDGVYDMLERVAGNSSQTNVHVVDVRGTLAANEWADEIHATSAGFAKVGKLFKREIEKAI